MTAAIQGIVRSNITTATAFTQVDLDAPGRQVGWLHFPQSPHDDAWGTVAVPIAVLARGSGPTVILTGGNHGDEHEGPIVLGEIIRDLDLGRLSGRLIILPAINTPAVAASHRTSPLDGLNFNRVFPGDAFGTITSQIASYMSGALYPIADALIDLHSGGSSLDIMPSGIVTPGPDAASTRRNLDAVKAFGAPVTVIMDNLGDPRTAGAAAIAAGLTLVGTEMAGGGAVSIEALKLCRSGTLNALVHLGAIAPDAIAAASPETRLLTVEGSDSYVLAPESGVFEPFHANGTSVSAGQPAGRVHFVESPHRTPVTLSYARSGIVYARRQPGRVRPGNCCLVVATPVT
jgi:N-alpha-acetyl-L-2,4-diaminobutyrate deacetylase